MDIEWQREQEKFGANKTQFMLECLKDLDANLKTMGTRLFVIRGNALETIKKFCKDHEITQMTYMRDAEIFYKQRDAEIKTIVNRMEIVTKSFGGHTLYEPDEIIEANGGEIPLSHDEFYKVVKTMGDPTPQVANLSATDFKEGLCNIESNHDEVFGVPSLTEFGFAENALSSWNGGEFHALSRLDEKMAKENLMDLPKRQSDANYLIEPSTTGLSPYMNYGCLSPRRFWAEANKLPETKAVAIRGQLMYREFFYTVASEVNNFTKMEGNRICRQIEWYNDESKTRAWREGKTGYPWIDAIIRQLITEGFTRHVCRYAIASFLCLGDLWLNWTVGQEMFEEYMIDGDYAMNAGCWMWCSGSAFCDEIPHRSLHPIKFGQKWDPQGVFVRKYCPELKDVPLRYLFSPWKAPRPVQEKAKCIIGEDYPAPIVDHNQANSHNLDLIKELNDLSLE